MCPMRRTCGGPDETELTAIGVELNGAGVDPREEGERDEGGVEVDHLHEAVRGPRRRAARHLAQGSSTQRFAHMSCLAE